MTNKLLRMRYGQYAVYVRSAEDMIATYGTEFAEFERFIAKFTIVDLADQDRAGTVGVQMKRWVCINIGVGIAVFISKDALRTYKWMPSTHVYSIHFTLVINNTSLEAHRVARSRLEFSGGADTG